MNKLSINQLFGNRKCFKFKTVKSQWDTGGLKAVTIHLYYFQITFVRVLNKKADSKFKKLSRKFKRHIESFRLFIKHSLLRIPVYYEYFARDCDMFETGGVGTMKGYFNFLKEREAFFLMAEGSSYYNIIPKTEFIERRGYVVRKDRVADAIENGRNGYWV